MGSSLAFIAALGFCVATCVHAAPVPAGTPVLVEITAPLSSRTLKPGDTFPLRLAQPILVDGKTVVEAGAVGGGQVVDAAAAGMMGKPAKLILAARYLDIGGHQVKLRAMQFVRNGEGRDGEVLALGFAIGIVSFLVKGGDIEVPAGSNAQAKLGEDLVIADNSETVTK
jgi:hypothetical protein